MKKILLITTLLICIEGLAHAAACFGGCKTSENSPANSCLSPYVCKCIPADTGWSSGTWNCREP